MQRSSILIATAASLFAPVALGTPGTPTARAQGGGAVESQRTTDEVRAMVAEMLADAETRTSLLQSDAGAGHDGGFFLASPDGNFRLNVSGQLQFRYTATFRDDEDGVDDFVSGFTTSRTALRFDGHIGDPSFFYAIQGNFDRDGGGFTLEDAYVGHQFNNGLALIWGQLRMPVLWEDVLNEKYALAVDQSVVNAVFHQGRSQGAWVHYSAEDWRFWAGFSAGLRSANTDYDDQPADWAVTSRWEWKFAGDWSQFDTFSSPRESGYATKLGGGAHFEQSPDRPGESVNDTFAVTADVMTKGDGWNFYAAGVGLFTDIGGGGSFTDAGVIAQGGIFVTDDIEPFLRYDAVIPDGDRAGSKTFNTLTAGANYYLHGHAAKFTFDVQWFFDRVSDNDLVSGVAAGGVGRGIGLLPSGGKDQVALRFQFQLLF